MGQTSGGRAGSVLALGGSRFRSIPPPCRRFFLAACDVPSLEDKFNVDQYSDLVTVSKPVIYISIGEMINTHTVRGERAALAASTAALRLQLC